MAKTESPAPTFAAIVDQTNRLLERFDEPHLSPFELRATEIEFELGWRDYDIDQTERTARNLARQVIANRQPAKICGWKESELHELVGTLRTHSAWNAQSLARQAEALEQVGRLAKSLANLAEQLVPLGLAFAQAKFASAFDPRSTFGRNGG